MKNANKQLQVTFVLLGIIAAALVFFITWHLTHNRETPAPSLTAYTTGATTEATTLPPPVTTTAPVTFSGVSDENYNILEDDNIQPLAEPAVITINEDLWYLTLVNRNYRMPADYTVNTEPAIPGCEYELDSRVAVWYTAMYNAAAQEGIYLTPYSGYRSYERQTINYENKTNYYLNQGYSLEQARAKAAMVIMPPGCSEHNLGLCMDIIDTADNFYTTAAYAWLQAHAADYGFILRYPKDKQAITQVEYEPWHWRYVGVDYAYAINQSGLCLEEYLAATGLMPAVQTQTPAPQG